MIRALFACIIAAVLLLARSAHAEDETTETARIHFQNGLRLHDQHPPDYAGALVEFEASFRAKPAPSTRLNMAICYRALRKYPEAIDALHEVLSMPTASLTIDARRAAERALVEMEALIGFIHVELSPIPPLFTVFVDGEARAIESGGALRVASGTHTVAVRARGYLEPPAQRIAVGGGKRVTAAFALSPTDAREATLTFRGAWPARVDIDGVPFPTDTPAALAPGAHRIALRSGGRVIWTDVSLEPGTERIVDVPRDDDPELLIDRNVATTFAARPWYVRGGPAVSGELLRFTTVVGEPSGGTRRTLYGPSFSLAAGRAVSDHFAVEIAADVGTAWRDYDVGATAASSQLDTLLIAPALRFRTKGSARFTSALGLGVASRTVTISRKYPIGTTIDDSATGTTATLVCDVGADVNLGRVFVSAAIFANVFRLAPLRTTSDARPFEGDLSLRTGARLGVGFEF